VSATGLSCPDARQVPWVMGNRYRGPGLGAAASSPAAAGWRLCMSWKLPPSARRSSVAIAENGACSHDTSRRDGPDRLHVSQVFLRQDGRRAKRGKRYSRLARSEAGLASSRCCRQCPGPACRLTRIGRMRLTTPLGVPAREGLSVIRQLVASLDRGGRPAGLPQHGWTVHFADQ